MASRKRRYARQRRSKRTLTVEIKRLTQKLMKVQGDISKLTTPVIPANVEV